MVKVVGLTPEEKQGTALADLKRAKLEHIVNIAKETFPKRLVEFGILGHLMVIGEKYDVDTALNFDLKDGEIQIRRPEALQDALKLAGAYESKGYKEITVKKLYE